MAVGLGPGSSHGAPGFKELLIGFMLYCSVLKWVIIMEQGILHRYDESQRKHNMTGGWLRAVSVP